jgi:hypothetical protein
MMSDVNATLAVEFISRNFPYVSVMSFNHGCLTPQSTGPEAAAAFIDAHADRDIYMVIAKPRDANLPGKPRRDDIIGSSLAWVDLDPPREMTDPGQLESWRESQLRQLERSGLPTPHIIIHSGRGLWLYWRLDRQVDVVEVEAINRGLAQKLGGDHCHDACRVARVPYTRNSKTGAIAYVLREEEGTIAPEALPHVAPSLPKAANDTAPVALAQPLTSLAELDEWHVDTRLVRIIEHGCDPQDPKQGDDSRSAWLWDCVLGLMRHGVPDGVILAILLDRRLRISDSVYDNPRGAEAYARRQIDRARDHLSDFLRDDKGRIISNHQQNVRVALTKLGVSLSHDNFANVDLIEGLAGFGPRLDDAAVRRLWFETQNRLGFQPRKEFFWEAVLDIAMKNTVNPVLDYLSGLEWDGQPRLDDWLVRCGGAPNTPFVRAVGAMTLIAAIRRVRDPGAKFDEMLVLEGDQGAGKSSALAILAGDPAWFSDSCPFNADGREVIEALSGKWIVEAGELAGLRKASSEKLKSFLSRTVDQGRAAYGRIPQSVRRQCIFIGTTNSAAYLNDGTGNRRFLPVRIERFDLECLKRDRDQLWAEAAVRERNGESIRLPESLWAYAAAEQVNRRVEDPIVAALETAFGASTGRIRASCVWDLLDIPMAQRASMAAAVGKAMQELGWERRKLRFGGPNPEWGYQRGTVSECQTRLTSGVRGLVIRDTLSIVEEAA